MPTRSASDYLSYVKAQVQSQSGSIAPKLTRTTPYNQGGVTVLNAITQASDMRYATRGQLPPGRVIARQLVLNRSNPKNLSQVATLSGGGVLGGVVNRPATRTSGTQGLIVLQTNLIQNANACGKGTTTFTGANQATSGGAF
jgi:hypothetical protein